MASSTLVYSTARNTSGDPATLVFRFAKAKTPAASTTLMQSVTLLANESRAMVASTTPTGLNTHQYLLGDDFYNVSQSGGALTGITGICTATFRSI